MLIKALRQINIKKKTQNKLQENERFNSTVVDGQVNTILVLVEEYSENLRVVLSNELEVTLENIKLLNFCNTIQKEDVEEGQFSEDDFGWFGKIKNKRIEKLVEQEYYVLLNYAVGNIYIDYLTSISNAKFKVGYANSNLRLYDLMIDINEPNISIFNSELKKYLKILNK